MEEPKDERVAWTSELIDALLALRFKDAALAAEIDGARGNEAKRKAWTALAARFQQERGVCVAENKIRRVVSKWQSQHRSWVAAQANKNGTTSERPPTYMPVLQRYFQDEGAGIGGPVPTAPVTAKEASSSESMVPIVTNAEIPWTVQALAEIPTMTLIAQTTATNLSKKRKPSPHPNDNAAQLFAQLEAQPAKRLQPTPTPMKCNQQATQPSIGHHDSPPTTTTSYLAAPTISSLVVVTTPRTPSPCATMITNPPPSATDTAADEVQSIDPPEVPSTAMPAVVSQDEESPATSQESSQNNHAPDHFVVPLTKESPVEKRTNSNLIGIPERPKRICLPPPKALPSAPEPTAGTTTAQFRKMAAEITHKISSVHQDQLLLQRKHFEQLLELQRSQYDEQFAIQCKQVDAMQAILEVLGVSATL